MSKRAAVQAPAGTRPIPADSRTGRHRAVVAMLAAAALAAYANSFSGPFVFDDVGSIVDNATIRSLWPPSGVLSPPAGDGQTVGGRPFLNLTFALNHAVSGLSVWSYHAANLAIHLAAALLLFGIVRRTRGAGMTVAAVIALLWCLHPLNTAAVTYTVQRAETLAGCLLLLTLYAFVRSVEDGAGGRAARWQALAGAACLAGMATKETMAAAPILVFLYDRTFVAGSFGEAWSRRWRLHVALACTWGLLAWLVLGANSRGGSAGFSVVTSRWDYLLTQADAIVRYLRLAVWPSGLTFDYGMSLASGPGEVAGQAAIVLALLAGTAWALVRRPPLGFLGAWFFLILAPSSSLLPVTSQTMAEHRMYLPLIAVVSTVAFSLPRVLPRQTLAFCALAAVALGATTFARNRDYRTAVDLWADTVAMRPDNPRAHVNLGTALAQAGRSEEAMRSFRDALRIYPDHASAHYNLGVALAAAGRPDEALAHLAATVRLEPTLADAHVNLGNALVRLGRPAEAVPHYGEALRLQPRSADTELNLGLALLAAGHPTEAIPPLRRAVHAMPGHIEGRFALGNALARAGDFPAAIVAYQELLGLAPEHMAARGNLANALLVAGRTREAIVEYEAVLHRRPGDAAIRANLEQARAMLREPAAEGAP